VIGCTYREHGLLPPFLGIIGMGERGQYRKRMAIAEEEFARCINSEHMRVLENSRLLLNNIRRDRPIEVQFDFYNQVWHYSQLIRG
jgi:hypothetical protein